MDYEDKTHPLPVLQDLKVSHPRKCLGSIVQESSTHLGLLGKNWPKEGACQEPSRIVRALQPFPATSYPSVFTSTIKRLLQPGAATSDILQQYVSTIKVLRYLDPPGVLLYGVAEPIRRYLRYGIPNQLIPRLDMIPKGSA